MKVALIGDIGLFGKYTLDNPNIKDYFKDVSELLNTADIVIGNLEVPLCTIDAPMRGKSAHIKSHPKNLDILNYLNVTHVSLANNHLYDFGKKGYNETLDNLNNSNIEYFGVENKEIFIEQETNKIALSGYVCYSTNALGYLEDNEIGVNELDFNKVRNTLLKNKKNGFLNLVSFHMGEEHIHYPNIDHIKMARKLSNELPFILYGHHPHVLQGIENYKDSLHIYSLGNFCFDDVYTKKSKKPLVKQQPMNKESCIVMLDIKHNIIVDHKLIPIFDSGKKIEITTDGSIDEKIKTYSGYLDINEIDYIKTRKKLIADYINKRKDLRDFKWYVKRLKLDSLIMILNAKKNRKKYINVFQKMIAEIKL